MKYFTIATAPLRPLPGSSVKLMDIPQYSVVDVLLDPRQYTDYGGVQIPWVKVVYRDVTGWLYEGRLEEAFVNPDVVGRVKPAPSHKPRQNIIWNDGLEKFNLCGEFCIAFAAEEQDIESFLNKWKAKDVSTFNRIVPGDKVTGVPDLLSMLSVYPGYTTATYKETMYDVVLARIAFTPRKLLTQTTANSIPILGVKIDKYTGNIQSSGIGHWVAVVDVEPYGVNRAVVTIYNPYTNSIEKYSWREIESSIGYSPTGIIIKR